MLSNGTVLNNLWKVGNQVGSGACATVYDVTNNRNKSIDYPLVAKVIKLPSGKTKKDKEQKMLSDTLYFEYTLIVGHLQEFPMRPKVPEMFYGEDSNYRYLVMEKLDIDLKTWSKFNQNPSYSMISDFGIQILNGLEWFHRKGYLYIDLKTENFMLKEKKLYFIDCNLNYIKFLFSFVE